MVFTKEHIEKILTVNGVDTSASEDEIKEVLISAKWTPDDVHTAMVVLRENTTTHEKTENTYHNIFNSNEKLTPEALQGLLGIQIDLSDLHTREKINASRNQISLAQMCIILVLSLTFATVFIMGFMYQQNVGIFYQT